MKATRTAIIVAAALAALSATASAPARAPARPGHAARAGFPYLSWPAAVAPKDPPVRQPVGHFRFWDGSALQDVEGRTLLATLVLAGGGAVDGAALRAAWERRLTALGARRIASGIVPASAVATINADDRKALAPGLGDVERTPVDVWTLRRPGRQVWFQYGVGDAQASLAVVEARLN